MLLYFMSLLILVSVPSAKAGPEDCLPMDSKEPKCSKYVDPSTKEPVFIEHSFNCSRFWVCEPDLSACLFECARANDHEALYFDVRFQYPVGPVCDWPSAINCTMEVPECVFDEDCEDNEYCYDEGDKNECKIGCRDDSNCETCGECINNVCTVPDCCLDADCPGCSSCSGNQCISLECCADSECTDMTCSTCNMDSHTCKNPECCSDADCKDNFFCSAEQICEPGCTVDSDCKDCATCENNACTEPECCVDTDCNDNFFCNAEQICEPGCTVDSDCDDCATCENNACTEPECCADTDCLASEYCTDAHICETGCNEDSDCTAMTCSSCDLGAMICNDPECCSDDDCLSSEYCTDAQICQPGCKTDDDCAGCAACDNHVCTEPECCVDDDCKDPDKPICSNDNLCMSGCKNDQMCPGWDSVCNPTYENCNWCNNPDNDVGQCEPGCIEEANCPGLQFCNGIHLCEAEGITVLKRIELSTGTCNGCQGTAKEDGPILNIMGGQNMAGVTSCLTNPLDHETEVDYAPGNTAVFEDTDDREVLGSCYKASLVTTVTGGSVTWTSSVGEWTLAENRVDFYWSDDKLCPFSCCLSQSVLSPASNKADLVDCAQNCGNSVTC